MRKNKFFLFIAIPFCLYSMEQKKGDPKTISTKIIVAQIAELRRQNGELEKKIHYRKNINFIQKGINCLLNKQEWSGICFDCVYVVKDDPDFSYFKGILDHPDLQSEWFAHLKNTWLKKAFWAPAVQRSMACWPRAIKIMDILLQAGADPEIPCEVGERGQIEGRKSALSVAVDQLDDDRLLLYFLRKGKDPNSVYYESDLKPAQDSLLSYKVSRTNSQGVPCFFKNQMSTLNILLYFGADPRHRVKDKNALEKATLSALVDFLNHCHARRVHRLGRYLSRCNSILPLELWYKIAQFHYGPLSDQDLEKIKTYDPHDYKILPEKAKK